MTPYYNFSSKVWLYTSHKAAWHFTSIPEDISAEITMFHGHNMLGWGSLPVRATIGITTWKTSIFSNKKTRTYLLPLKAEIRKQENIAEGDDIKVTLEVLA